MVNQEELPANAVGCNHSRATSNKKVGTRIRTYETSEVTLMTAIVPVKSATRTYHTIEEEWPSDRQKTCVTKLWEKVYYLPLVHCEFWISALFSLLMAFYPKLASSRGLEAWKFGFIFSSYKLSMFIASALAKRMVSYH